MTRIADSVYISQRCGSGSVSKCHGSATPKKTALSRSCTHYCKIKFSLMLKSIFIFICRHSRGEDFRGGSKHQIHFCLGQNEHLQTESLRSHHSQHQGTGTLFLVHFWRWNVTGLLLTTSIVDPHHVDADPDSTYHPDADPFYLMRIRIRLFIG